MTLLTVDYRLTDDAVRLAESFRRYVSGDWPMIAVQNYDRSRNPALRRAGYKVAGFGSNVGHGLGLEWGLQRVRTEYVLVCDPDSILLPGFADEALTRLRTHGICGVILSDAIEHQRYHPVCLAFRMSLWHAGGWSMIGNWPQWDVAEQLTQRHGLNRAALLPIVKATGKETGGGGVLWGNVASAVFGSSRLPDVPPGGEMYGVDADRMKDYHRRWRAWADDVAAGTAGAEGFPPQVR
jgi:hypothetical protein